MLVNVAGIANFAVPVFAVSFKGCRRTSAVTGTGTDTRTCTLL
jgi:hypothetical protein